MKKLLSIVIALALALTFAFAVAAEDALPGLGAINDAGNDIQQVFSDLTAQFGVDEVKAAVTDFFADMKIEAGTDAADLPANAGEALAAEIIGRFGLEGTDFAAQLTSAMSNDFVSFLAQMYVTVPEPPEPPETEVKGPDPKPPTGDSSAIAIATFAALSVAAAAAFVCLKKKED